MSFTDVARQEWVSALESFGREHRAWIATVEHVAHDGSRDVWLTGRPLAGVFAEPQPSGVAVRIELAPDLSPESSSVRISEPTAVRLDRDRDGSSSALEIDDRDGGRTRVRFRVAPPLDMLDGLAPGEL
jgi:hypothetical protein